MSLRGTKGREEVHAKGWEKGLMVVKSTFDMLIDYVQDCILFPPRSEFLLI